jgi:hypothetical protein
VLDGSISPGQAQQTLSIYIPTFASVLYFFFTTDILDCIILYTAQNGGLPGLWNGMYSLDYPQGPTPLAGAALQAQRCQYLAGFLYEYINLPLYSPYVDPTEVTPLITYLQDTLQPGVLNGTIPVDQAQLSITWYIPTYAVLLDFEVTTDFFDCLISYTAQNGGPTGLWNGTLSGDFPHGPLPFGGSTLQAQRCVYLGGYLSEFINDPLVSPYAYTAIIPPLITYLEDTLQPGVSNGTISPAQAQQSIALYLGSYPEVVAFNLTCDMMDSLILYTIQIGGPPGLWNNSLTITYQQEE